MDKDSIQFIAITAFLTYSLPKIIELVMKRFGEPKINLDTQNIKNALELHETLNKKYVALEEKYEKLEKRNEEANAKIDLIEERNAELERSYWKSEHIREQLETRLAQYEGGRKNVEQ